MLRKELHLSLSFLNKYSLTDMKRPSLIFLFLFLATQYMLAQKSNIDSLRNVLINAANDSLRYVACHKLYTHYEEVDKDSASYYADKMITLAKQNHHILAEALGWVWKGYQFTSQGKFANAHQYFTEGLQILENNLDAKESWPTMDFAKVKPESTGRIILAVAHQMFGLLLGFSHHEDAELFHLHEALQLAHENGDSGRVGTINIVFGRRALRNNQLDSALSFYMHAHKLKLESNDLFMLANLKAFIGNVYFQKKNYSEARRYYLDGIQQAGKLNHVTALVRNYFGITDLYLTLNRTDSSLYYARESVKTIKTLAASNPGLDLGIAYENLYRSFEQRHQRDSAFFYQGLALTTKDKLYNERINNLVEVQSLSFGEQLRLRELENEKENYRTRIKTYALAYGLITFIIIAYTFYRMNRAKQKTNIMLESTLTDLKATQAQLIQSEKMASLGELTAGIAHEIQNPLNFVNNFSEINNELIKELDEAVSDERRDASYEADIRKNIKENSEKINHHGKRADAIVKSMLQHSRGAEGANKKEASDINALAEEYFRLAYHGLKAKDKDFNSKMKSDFDSSIGSINIIPQEIGRVLLNLINNAFYAVNEKKKLIGETYDPEVSVKTKKEGKKVLISVKDNGNGIPQNVLDKIFQPFFTTKPTGQGTGLGLSLAYDIVKSHGGELKVETKEGDGSTFIIQIPTN